MKRILSFFNNRVFILLIMFSAIFSYRVSAQETSGGLEGKIVDTAGQPLSNVSVTAVHVPTGTRYGAMTAADGHYQFTDLRIGGPYSITVSLVGRESRRREDIRITLGKNQIADFILTDKTEQLTEVVVRGARGSLRVNQYGAGANISATRIRNMPTSSRSIQDMTRLVPQGSKDNSFGGANFRYNNVTVDGAVNNDAIGFSPSLGGTTGSSGMPGSSTRSNPISLDAIEDIQVYLSPFDVKIGNFTGGSINAVTRSGSNRVTGSVYTTGRNSSLTGPDHAGDGSRMPSGFHEWQTGFRVGFPLVKDKLFFFTNEEITRRQDIIELGAGSKGASGILSADSARQIVDYLQNKYGFQAGAYGNYQIYSNSSKYFNRLDWNISDRHQLAIRNNFVSSRSTNLERDQQDFRFGSINYTQNNTQQSTVAELKSRLSGAVSNILLLGYSSVHDYRTPSSDAAFPQVQIAGNTPGTTIFLGTDREAAVFDMRQKTIEITDNITWRKGRNTFLFGTHNELYTIGYGFVNSWNGRVDYLSIHDFLDNQPSRVRGSYNYSDNTRSYILGHPSNFHVDMYSAYLQDEIRVTDRLKVTPGIRFDMTVVPRKPVLSARTQNAWPDPGFGTTYTYTPLNQIENDYLGRRNMQFSPRVGVNWDIRSDQSLVLRGGSGLFTGRIPFAWMGYSFYNNGDSYGAYDQRSINTPYTPGSDPLLVTNKGIAAFAAANGQAVTNKYAGATQVDVIDNHFRMPQVWRSSIALDYKPAGGWSFTVEAIYTKTLYDVKFQQVNLRDDPRYFAYDTLSRRQPVFNSGNIDPAFANAYELSNTGAGYRYSLTAQAARRLPDGLGVYLAYTYGQSKDITNGIRNSMESNWQLNQALNPNNPGLAWSNFDIRHRIVGTIDFQRDWGRRWSSAASLFVSAQSGSPFTYGFVNFSVQGTPQQVSLAYIPRREESVNFFQDVYAPGSDHITLSAGQQADVFNRYIDGNKYLSSRRGDWTGRNAGRTPWNTQADLRLTQDLHFIVHGSGHTLSFTYDILNLTNLVNKKWGWSYFSPNTFNSTASVGLVQVLDANQKPLITHGGYPAFTFADPGRPYSVDFFASRWQMQMGLRYSF